MIRSFPIARVLRTTVAAALLLPVAAACSDDDDDGVGPQQQARLRAVHAIANAPAVTIRVDEATAANGAVFRDVTNYTTVNAGQRRIRVTPVTSSNPVIDATVTLAGNTDYTVIAAGSATSTTAPTAIAPIVLTDDNTVPAAGQIRVRAVHAASSVGNVDIFVSGANDALPAQPAFANVPFRASSAYAALPAGAYRVRITPAGTRTVAIDVTTGALAAGTVAKLIAVDGPNAAVAGATLVAVVDRAP